MYFSPLLITSSVLVPLRYFFSTYSKDKGLVWDTDEKLRTIEIGDFHDYNKIAIQERPRVLVSRGGYAVNTVGVSNSMAESASVHARQGLVADTRMLLYSGMATVLIEARNKGTCELVTDMVTHFLSWSRGEICNSQGFKRFADPLQVSECTPTQDQDTPTFQVTIQVPYVKEELFTMRTDGVLLKAFSETGLAPAN